MVKPCIGCLVVYSSGKIHAAAAGNNPAKNGFYFTGYA
jgi:hypothetical protein